MLERIEEIRGEAAAAIGAAGSSAALEELRVRYLGRKAELTMILRGIAELPPAERGAVGGTADRERGAEAPGHILRSVARGGAAAHPHLAGPGALDGGAGATDLHRRPRQGLPARLRCHPQPDVPPDGGAGDRRGADPGRPQG